MKPIILYVDDEPHNLTVFEAALPDEWEVKTFQDPIQALEALDKIAPWVIVSDQRMPGVSGVRLLELAKKLRVNAIRIIVTGYSEEALMIDSVRKAQIFDYIKKPWEADDVEASVRRAIDIYRANEQARTLLDELKERERLLAEQNLKLVSMTQHLEDVIRREVAMKAELECWVPPYVRWALQNPQIHLPVKKQLVGITFDIIGSSRIHGTTVNGKPLRARVIELFSEAILRNGGWRESHSGDSAYAHFGLNDDLVGSFEAALAAAREFRVSLRSMGHLVQEPIECGIGLHVAHDAVVDIHQIQLSTPKGLVTQKSFDTSSSEIDLLHRIEKLVHDLPGSNIIMTEDFLKGLRFVPDKCVDLGLFTLRGQNRAARLYLLPSDLVKEAELRGLMDKHGHGPQDEKAA